VANNHVLKGYDFDGVISIGIIPDRHGVIITGRSYEEAPEINNFLRSKGIFNPVYFNPAKFDFRSAEVSGRWKSNMIDLLGVHEFFEDEKVQADIIMEERYDMVKGRYTLKINMVKPDGSIKEYC